jgi:hypothetical protein
MENARFSPRIGHIDRMVTKPKLILCLALVLSANSVFASSVNLHVLPNPPPDWNVPVSVQLTDADFGKHFTVFLKDIGADSDEFIGAQLEVSSEDNQIASCPVGKKWTTNGVQFEFTVSAAYVQASRFRVAILSHRGKQPMPSFTAYWFYLRDFATNNAPVARQTGCSEVAPEIIKALPKRVRALRSGTTAVEVWKRLNLAANRHSLSNDNDDLYPDRYRLSWNYAIEFTFEKTTNDFTIEKTADGQTFFKDNRKLIRAIVYKNGLEICRSGK